MKNKALSIFLISLNVLGILCLIWLAIPLILQDGRVPNPDAMLPMARWDGSGALLTVGLLPLIAANILGFFFIARGQIRLKYRLLFFLPGLLCTLLVLYYLLLSFHVLPFYGKLPIAQVQLEAQESGKTRCYTVYEDENYSLSAGFEGDPVEIYTANYSCFEATIEDGVVRNRFVRCSLKDEEGQPIEADETLTQIMRHAAEEIEHDIWLFQIIRDGNDTFVYIKLNVNWHDPCDLYRYDPENDTLTHLCHWEDKNFKGIRLCK